MDVDGVCALLTGIVQQACPRLFVTGGIGVLTDGHAEYLAELRPVSQVASLIERVWRTGGQLAQAARVVADDKAIGESVQRNALDIGFVQHHLPLYCIEVLAVDEVVGDPAALIAVELAQGEAPQLGRNGVLHELTEPGAPDLRVHLIHRFAVTLEDKAFTGNRAQSLVDDAGQVTIRHDDGVIDVIQHRSVVEVNGRCALEAGHVSGNVEVEQLRTLQDDSGVLLARQDVAGTGGNDILFGHRTAAFFRFFHN